MNNIDLTASLIERGINGLTEEFESLCDKYGVSYDFTKMRNNVTYVSYETHTAFKIWAISSGREW